VGCGILLAMVQGAKNQLNGPAVKKQQQIRGGEWGSSGKSRPTSSFVATQL